MIIIICKQIWFPGIILKTSNLQLDGNTRNHIIQVICKQYGFKYSDLIQIICS